MSEIKHAIEGNREMRVLGVTNYFVNRLHTHQKVIEKHQMRVEALQMIPKYLFTPPAGIIIQARIYCNWKTKSNVT